MTLVEFGDLQCPVCKGFAEEIIPQVIEVQVRNGKAQIDFRNFTIIGEQSVAAGAAALAAGEQGRGWNFVELFYRNQGFEALRLRHRRVPDRDRRSAGVPDIARWNEDRKSAAVLDRGQSEDRRSRVARLRRHAVVRRRRPGTDGLKPLGTPARPRTSKPRSSRRARGPFDPWVYITTIIVRWI